MKNEDVNEEDLKAGRYCWKGVPGCFCSAGWPYERQCPDCRDNWKDGQHRDSCCICPPPEGKG